MNDSPALAVFRRFGGEPEAFWERGIKTGKNCFVQDRGTGKEGNGKGRIRGGAVSAGKVIVMNEIGSPAGIITHVSVDAVSEFRERLVNISKKLAEVQKK